MAPNSVSLTMEGEVPLDHFAQAVAHFESLVTALTRAVVPPGENVRWVINYLEAGSAGLGVEGHGAGATLVVDAFERLGEAAERGQPVPFPRDVREPLANLTALMNGDVTELRFGANEKAFVVAERLPSPPADAAVSMESVGSVTGRIETLAHRSMKVSLYGLMDDRRVDCHLSRGQEALVDKTWGRLAIVQGLVKRDLRSGAAVSIRQITHVETFDDPEPGGWRASAGIAPAPPGSPPPEATIRRMRDGE